MHQNGTLWNTLGTIKKKEELLYEMEQLEQLEQLN